VIATTERINVYRCNGCGAQLVTVDRHEGVTPYLVRCNQVPLKGCGGDMRSSFYRPPADHAAPTHEWYKPTDAELKIECRKHSRRVADAVREHCAMGGLLIRPIAA
jgi:hypothetical protein